MQIDRRQLILGCLSAVGFGAAEDAAACPPVTADGPTGLTYDRQVLRLLTVLKEGWFEPQESADQFIVMMAREAGDGWQAVTERWSGCFHGIGFMRKSAVQPIVKSPLSGPTTRYERLAYLSSNNAQKDDDNVVLAQLLTQRDRYVGRPLDQDRGLPKRRALIASVQWSETGFRERPMRIHVNRHRAIVPLSWERIVKG